MPTYRANGAPTTRYVRAVRSIRWSAFVHVVLFVDPVHTPRAEECEEHGDVDRTLLCEPEAELEAADRDAIQLLDEKNAEDVGAGQPDSHAGCNETQVGAPVGGTVRWSHRGLFRKTWFVAL